MDEYVFDVKLWAICRVMAENEAAARQKMRTHIECLDVGYQCAGVAITEVSIDDNHAPNLIGGI